jgi:outer membrane protein OmpA-like peptidoglycan-associated protein
MGTGSREIGGQNLPLGVRSDLEPAFGVDFSSVRVHTDARAHRLAAALGADAFTVGSDIFFGSGKWHPESAAGRRLLAHELVHTVQQAGDSPIVQCFVPCTRARLSLEECPKREPGEVEASLREPMTVEYLEAPVQGYVIARFGAGQSRLKAGVTSNPNWAYLVQALSDASSQWEVIGLSDCHGEEAINTSLRQERADAVRAALPAAAAAQVTGTRAASLYDCVTDNTSRDDRAWNRSVLIALESRTEVFPDEKIEGTRPVPKPVAQPTSDCPPSSKSEIAAAKPIAVAMAEKALVVLGSSTPTTDRLLRKYFNDSSVSTYMHVRSGFLSTLSGLRTSVTIECERKGSWFYDHFCASSSTSVTTAYVRPLGFRVHLCEAAFGSGDLDLARTLVHEFSHMFDSTDDEEYCWSGCSSSLDRWDAYDNADSYAGFAADAYLL